MNSLKSKKAEELNSDELGEIFSTMSLSLGKAMSDAKLITGPQTLSGGLGQLSDFKLCPGNCESPSSSESDEIEKTPKQVKYYGKPPIDPNLLKIPSMPVSEDDVSIEDPIDNPTLSPEEKIKSLVGNLEGFVCPNKKKQDDSIISVNGLDHDIFQTLSPNEQQLCSQCQYCLKYYNKIDNVMVTNEYDPKGETTCFHCIFMLIYSQIDSRINFDGAFGKTIVEYIMECKDCHDKNGCIHPTECFVCDYLNGIPIENIHGADQLFAICEMKQESEDNFSVEISI